MTKTHLKSAQNDQKSTEIPQKWPKLIWHHLHMIKISLKIWPNGQKAPQNVKIMQKNTKNGEKWAKNAMKMGQKRRNCVSLGNPLSLLHWGPPRKPAGPTRCARSRPRWFSRWASVTFYLVCTDSCTIDGITSQLGVHAIPRYVRLSVRLILGIHA